MKKILHYILETFYPTRCLDCGRYGALLCAPCAKAACTPVARLLETGSTKQPVVTLYSCAPYAHKHIKRAIRDLKFSGVTRYAEPLGVLLADILTQRIHNKTNTVVIPIPLHTSRLRERGYNQAEQLAVQLCARTGWELRTDILFRQHNTNAQTGISHTNRSQNTAEAFAVYPSIAASTEKIQGKTIIIVDDVVTTGSTLHNAVKPLLDIPNITIFIVTVAYS